VQSANFALRADPAAPRECAVVFRPIEDLPSTEAVLTILGTDEKTLEEYETYVESLRGSGHSRALKRLRASVAHALPVSISR